MTFMAAGLILISLAASDARALRPASTADVKTIQTLLNNAELIQVDVDIAKKRLDATKLSLKKSPNDPVLKSQVASDARILESIVRDRDLARNKAIHRTLTAYGIVPAEGSSGKPKMPSGVSVASDYNGQTSHWRVVAGDDVKRTNLNARGVRIHTGPIKDPDARASTDGWGITVVYANAFSSPEYLALILSHEKEHFEQYTTKGRGDKLSTNELDVEAWAKTEKDALLLGFGANDPVTKAASRTRADYEKAVAADKWRQKWSLGLLKPAGIAQATPRTPAEVADIGRRFDDLSEVVAQEIKFAREEAAAQRRAQDEIARRDRDDRLRYTKADMARRSCANPGSVTQSELDALPDPYNKNFVESPPGSLDSCAFMLYLRLGRGADADEIRQHSIPPRPIDVNSPPSLIPARPIPPSEAITLNPKTPFSSVLPGLKNLAETACSAPGRASVDESLIRPRMPFSFAGERDDQTAANLSIGLGDCPRQLFNKLIEMIRSGKEAEITNIWIRDVAAVYSRPAFSRPAYVAPPRSGGDPCRDNGNRRCP